MTAITLTRVAPLTTIQDAGRLGQLRHGIGESGPMDSLSFFAAGARLGASGAAIEFTQAGLDFSVEGGPIQAAFAGGDFRLTIAGQPMAWNASHTLPRAAKISIAPGAHGNYGYVRFAAEIDVPKILGSRSTNSVVGLGGLDGRALKPGDRLRLLPLDTTAEPKDVATPAPIDADIRIIWGIHADLFPATVRENFLQSPFEISPKLDRMGVRLADPARVLADSRILGLVSDAVIAGDIQILGDGTPIVLMRDHQPTGGYPRIATIISADLDRFAQLRPGSAIRFQSVTPQHARALGVSGGRA